MRKRTAATTVHRSAITKNEESMLLSPGPGRPS
jgi:K+/H+ antiporter YhaU regulatory subunit KhtT